MPCLIRLKDDLSQADRQTFLDGINLLKAITGTEGCYVGVPSSTNRPVIDCSYDDRLDHPVQRHGRPRPVSGRSDSHGFSSRYCSPMWKRVVIYDPQE